MKRRRNIFMLVLIAGLISVPSLMVFAQEGSRGSLPDGESKEEAQSSGPSEEDLESLPLIILEKDPFKSFIKTEVPVIDEDDGDVPLTPLQKYKLAQIKLVAIIWSIEEPVAMFEDDAGEGYIVKKGTLIGKRKGKVSGIFKDRVVVEQRVRDFKGNIKIEEVSIELPVEEEGI